MENTPNGNGAQGATPQLPPELRPADPENVTPIEWAGLLDLFRDTCGDDHPVGVTATAIQQAGEATLTDNDYATLSRREFPPNFTSFRAAVLFFAKSQGCKVLSLEVDFEIRRVVADVQLVPSKVAHG